MSSPRALSPRSREVLSCASPLRPRSGRSLWNKSSRVAEHIRESEGVPLHDENMFEEDDHGQKVDEPTPPHPRIQLPCTPRDRSVGLSAALDDTVDASLRVARRNMDRSISPGRAAWERLRTPSPEITYMPSARDLAGTPTTGASPLAAFAQQTNLPPSPPPLSPAPLFFMPPNARASPATSPSHAPQSGQSPPASPQKSAGVLATSPKAAWDDTVTCRLYRDHHQGRNQANAQAPLPQFFQQQIAYEATSSLGGSYQWHSEWQRQNCDYPGGTDFSSLATSRLVPQGMALGGGYAEGQQVRAYGDSYLCQYGHGYVGDTWPHRYVGRMPVDWDDSDVKRFHFTAVASM